MPAGVKLIDSTLVVVLHNGEQEIQRELASPADDLRAALIMLARRGRLEIGDVLKVLASSCTAAAGRGKSAGADMLATPTARRVQGAERQLMARLCRQQHSQGTAAIGR
jgi:hypothetical protein